jgi:hypothetical protein
MSQEAVRNAEQIKQEIDFQKEDLKFLNSFYLPLVSGIVVTLFGNGPILAKVGSICVGSIAMGFLTLFKRDKLNSIRNLINEL